MLRKILIVDDSEINRAILKHMLQDEYEVWEAENGKSALKKMSEQKEGFSVILLDLVMPEMDGFEVLTNMRADEILRHIPVIVTTGNTEEGTEVKALKLGANDYIKKPYNPESIRNRIRNTIRLRENAAIVNATRIDALTGLYSREAFFERAMEMISEKEPGFYVMGCFDVDKFKVINDQYGTAKGDAVLRLIANIFREGFGESGGICCRIMADNYAVLYPKTFIESEEIRAIREKASVLDGSIAPLTFSIGRYIVDDITLSPSSMYDRATMAKNTVKGQFEEHIGTYEEAMRNRVLKQQEITSEMKTALKGKQFEVWFQPQYNHATGRIIGAEALVRWRHPVKGLIPPGVFIPIFEQNGFVYEIDKYVWEETCAALKKWQQEGYSQIPASVNISRYDIRHEDLVEVITGLTKKYEIPVDLLRLEITESAFAQSGERVIEVVKRLQAEGFIMEIDDFGSGYSSLNTLKDVPADILKLDMKFLNGKENLERGGIILESIVEMAKKIQMSVIAEGVEQKGQADFLQDIGCTSIQGYYYAKPMPIQEYEELRKGEKEADEKEL